MYRYFFVGGVTSLPCSLSTLFAGIFAALIFRWNNGKFFGLGRSVAFVFLFLGFDFLLILLLTPPTPALELTSYIYLPMTFADVFGMFIVSMLMKETIDHLKENPEIDGISIGNITDIIKEYF